MSQTKLGNVLEDVRQPTNTGALATLVMVFFFWGFIAASNSIFIPFCKTHFNLSQFESQLIGSAFYIAYFAGSLVLFFISNVQRHTSSPQSQRHLRRLSTLLVI